MIPNDVKQKLETVGEGVKVVGNFRITDATQARILVSLSDKMYTRKELAFIREYSTNAADAHIVAKKPISEIIIDLPTLENLNFRIRDFGSGLTEEQIATVYCVFGESTKRNSNEMNGLLGYGCKAGFAHADSFTVTSWINGEKSIYQCVKGDSSKLHSAMLLSRSPSSDPTGIEIQIPVAQSSIWTVHREAANFYKHWPELPTILNMADGDKEKMEKFRNNPPTLKGEGWEIRPKSDGTATGVAYMGWVAYAIDWNVLSNRMSLTSQKRVLFELLQSNDVTLFYKMGEVCFIDSRENLEYTELTLNALMERLESIFTKIKDAIQERFDPAPNLWEAKKLYYAIFDSGLGEVDSGEDSVKETVERIKILDGNLMRLETTFQGAFTWNGLPLTSAYFKDINCFDNADTATIRSNIHDPSIPVMATYRRKNKRAKLLRCTSEKNNRITASDSNVIVLNDVGLKSGQSVIARYLIFRDNSRVRAVHVLNFADDTIKANFYAHYNFDTVPVIKYSEIIADAKAWNAANKTARNYGGGGGGSRPMQYIDVEAGTIEEVEVPIRELEDGGYFIMLGEGRRRSRQMIGANSYTHYHFDTIVENLKTFVEKTGIDLDRVYILPVKTRESKWFNAALDSGDWTNVWTLVKESMSEVKIDVQAIVDARAYNACSVIAEEAANKLSPLIREKNSYILQVVKTVTSKKHSENGELADALENLDLLAPMLAGITPSLNYSEVKEKMLVQYPMLSHYSYELEKGYNFDDEKAKEVAKYINAMDVYVELYGDESTVEAPAVESEAVPA
jgi:hypothetical protein